MKGLDAEGRKAVETVVALVESRGEVKFDLALDDPAIKDVVWMLSKAWVRFALVCEKHITVVLDPSTRKVTICNLRK